MMKKVYFLLLIISVFLAGCAEKTGPIEVMPETTAAQEPFSVTAEITQPPVTEPVVTLPPTQPPREIGPKKVEGNAVTIENVSVEYRDELPGDIKSSTTYSACGFRDELILNESQVYAVIQFTVTNKTAGEIKIADIHDAFLVELIFDNRYVYSPDSDSWCIFKAAAQTAVVSDSASVGTVALAPLSTKEVAVYIPCSREVSEAVGKNLDVVFSSNYCGYETYDFVIR